ncbi:hypothetical protein ACIRF8_10035 [Streptomyces sp. NPDC102406]|uniref:hypothetical protein n=1 Tax=Streptomyces sp. NPDC102406 TaxID=3366171 RepID=UPI0038018214
MSYDRTHEDPLLASGLRMLPWQSDTGRTCFLSTDADDAGHGRSVVTRLADQVEDRQLTDAAVVMEGARAVLDDPAADEQTLRRALAAVTQVLGDTLRVADSRGARLMPEDPPDTQWRRHPEPGR